MDFCPSEPKCDMGDPGCEGTMPVVPFDPQPRKIVAGQAAGDNLGTAVATSGEKVAVGAYGVSQSKGQVTIYEFKNTEWAFSVDIPNPAKMIGNFGSSVSITNELLAVGAPNSNGARGSAYIFRFDGTAWQSETSFVNSGGAIDDRQGWSIALSGSSVVVGKDGSTGYQGSAVVFAKQSGAGWPGVPAITAPRATANDRFGATSAIYSDTLLIGAPGKDGTSNNQGAAYIFVKSGTNWILQQKLVPDGGSTANEYFGYAVALQGDLAVIGATGFKTDKGGVYLFSRTGSQWQQQGILEVTSPVSPDNLGTSVSISGNSIIAGAAGRSGGRGSAFIFTLVSGKWMQQSELFPSDGIAGDHFGSSVSISGNTAVVGAPDKNSAKGAFYIYNRPAAQ